MKKYDIVVVGGGVVGSAIALKSQRQYPNQKIILLEKEAEPAKHQTGHNSGVIHSGIYYKPGSEKAKNCTEGYRQLLIFLREQNLPHEICGKIIVASGEAEFASLNTIYERGVANGLHGLKPISATEIKEYEPHAVGAKGLYVPQAGIVDYTQVATAYQAEFCRKGGEVLFNHAITDVHDSGHQVELLSANGTIVANLVIFACGLFSDRIAAQSIGARDFKIIPFRGEYYQVKESRRYLVRNLIYPVPDSRFPFLGVHLTRMIGGEIEAGPNAVLAFKREGYCKTDINLYDLAETLMWPGFHTIARKYWRTGCGEMYRSFSKMAFTKALQKLVPEIQIDDLEPAGAGVRAQASDRAGLVDDFDIRQAPRRIHVCNAPSPAATSSLAIADCVLGYVERMA